jgi:hypothetical protein
MSDDDVMRRSDDEDIAAAQDMMEQLDRLDRLARLGPDVRSPYPGAPVYTTRLSHTTSSQPLCRD